MVHLKLERYEEVIKDANKALDIDSDYVKAYHRRGKAYLATNQLEQALHDFEQCIARHPDDPEILESLSDVCDRLDDQAGFEHDMDPSSSQDDTQGATAYEMTESESGPT